MFIYIRDQIVPQWCRVFDIDLENIPPPAPPVAPQGNVSFRIDPAMMCVNSSSPSVTIQYTSTVPLFHFSFGIQAKNATFNTTGTPQSRPACLSVSLSLFSQSNLYTYFKLSILYQCQYLYIYIERERERGDL